MVGLIAHVYRLLRALVIGFKDEEFRALTLMTAVLILSGSFFYHYTEGWRYLDALYFCVATLTTVGYGDFVPKTDIGKVFTIIYIIGGVGLILGYLNLVAEFSRQHRKR